MICVKSRPVNHNAGNGKYFVFIARQHAMHAERVVVFTNVVRLSVVLSVRPTPVLCPNEWTYRHTFYDLVRASFEFL